MEFTKRDTNIAKFFGIVLMLMHHLFFSLETLDANCPNLTSLLPKEMLVLFSYNIGKVCVSIFIFLTGYGITKSYAEKRKKLCRPFTAVEQGRATMSRYINLEGSFFFIYIISLAIAFLSTTNNPTVIYTQSGIPVINAIIDALGLATGFVTPTLNGTWWYMTLALIAILILPMLIEATKSFGILITLLFLLVLPFTGIQNEMICCYLPALALGVYCAEQNIFRRLGEMRIGNLGKFGVRSVKIFVTLLLIILFIWLRIRAGYMGVNNTILAFLMILLSFFLFHSVIEKKGFISVLVYIGELSPIIFLTHTFVYYYYFSEFIYSFQYPIVIFLVTFVCAIALAAAIDGLQKISGYNRLLAFLREKVDHS